MRSDIKCELRTGITGITGDGVFSSMCEWVSVCAWRCIFDVYPKSKLLYARTFDPG